MAPRHVERTDFFQSFFEKLKQHEEIKDLRVSLVDTVGGGQTDLQCPQMSFVADEAFCLFSTPSRLLRMLLYQ